MEEIDQLEGLADIVSFDFVADKETIREVYGLEREPEDYLRVYRALRRKVPVMPHLTLGLKEGKWDGEESCLGSFGERRGRWPDVYCLYPYTRHKVCKSPASQNRGGYRIFG